MSLTTTPGTSFSVVVMATTNASAAPTVTPGTLPAGLSCSNVFPLAVPASGVTLNFTTSPSIADGNYSIVLNGQAGTTTAKTTLAVTITGSTGLSLMLGTGTGYAGQGAVLDVTSGAPIGYTGLLPLSFPNLPSGITVPNQPLILIPGAQQIGIAFDSSVVPGNYTLNGVLAAGNQQVNASATITVLAPTGVASSASNIDIIPGGTAPVKLWCMDSAGSNCTLQVTVSGLPTGLTATPGPPWSITSQGINVLFVASSSLPVGVYPVTFTGTNGNYSTTLVLTFYVNNANYTLVGQSLQPQTAVRKGSSASMSFEAILNVLPGGVANFGLDMSITGLSQGTTAVFSPSHLTPGGTTILTISAAADAVTTYNQGLLITATPTITSVLPQSVGISLDVVPGVGSLPVSRSDFLNVDGSQLSGVFDPLHEQAFVANPDYNRVDVVSIANRSVLASIQVPQPASLTMSLDGTKVIVGTKTSQVLWIDTTSLQVTKTYRVPPFPTHPPSNAPAAPYVHELSDGTLLVVPQPNESSLMIVNPSNGHVTTPMPPGFGLQSGPLAVNDQGTKVVLVPNGNPPMLAVYDVATQSFVSTSSNGSVKTLAIDSAGTHVLVGGQSFDMYDISLNHLGVINTGQTALTIASLFSPDGKTAYVDFGVGSAAFPTIYSVDVASLTPTSLASSSSGIPFYADGSGLLFGTEPFGLTLDDATFNIPAPVGALQVQGLVPSVGPVSQQTQTQLGANSEYPFLPDVYFGSQPASNQSLQTSAPYIATVNAPASSVPGPVNVKFVWPNGTEWFLPFGFTYGPKIEKVLTNETSPTGGASASLVALGVPADSTQVQLTIGGNNAAITASGQPNNYPFPATKLTFSAPAGITGPADISLVTPSGTTTIKDGFRYSQSVQDYPAPVSGTVYHSLLFNPKLNELYLSAGDHVDVFSAASMSFGSSLSSAALSGKIFGGLAISPDGNTLYVTDTTDGSLLIADPKNLSAGVTAIPIAPASIQNNCLYGPVFVAVTSNSKAYVTYDTTYSANCAPGFSFPTSYLVDLPTHAVSTPSFNRTNCGGNTVTSRDGNELAFSPVGGYGSFCVYDVPSATAHDLDSGGQYGTFYPNGLAVSGDGTRVAFEQGLNNSWVVANALGNVVSFAHASPLFALRDLALTTMKLTDSGGLLYVLYPNNLDIFDTSHGTLQRRLSLTETAKAQLDSLAVDLYGERAYVLTDNGLTVITLDVVPLSVSTLLPSAGPVGTSVTVRGNGFDSQTTASLNGITAPVNLIDANTLTLTIPAGVSGMLKLTLSNPDGQNYTLEGAFSEQ